jgi:uncharacterized protein YutE (UPF0331/DUF86 family)
MVERDVVLAKVAAIERCLKRISQVRSGERRRVLLPVDVEDIVAVNLQRAAQAAIDLALHVAASEGYGLPDDLAEGFILLEKNGVIDSDLREAAADGRVPQYRGAPVRDSGSGDSRSDCLDPRE